MRLDVAIIGAECDGLAASALLAGAGLRVGVFDRRAAPGGRVATRVFHPGYAASACFDSMPPVPTPLFRALDLGRRGAGLLPPERFFTPDATPLEPGAVASEAARRRIDWLARLLADADTPRGGFFSRRAGLPLEPWSEASLESLMPESQDTAQRVAAMAVAMEGRADDPARPGSALHLLAPGAGARFRGGAGALGDAMARAASVAGARLTPGCGVADIRGRRGGFVLHLTDGGEAEARFVVSALDARQTFLPLFAWADLPAPLLARLKGFRMAGGRARLLLALARRPRLPDAMDADAALVLPGGDMAALAESWRAGVIPARPHMMARLVSAADPGLAPPGGAVMTLTAGGVPAQPFDGPWTPDGRAQLTARMLAALEAALPGVAALVTAYELILPGQMETEWSASAGDMEGGVIAPDQMFGFRFGARTAIPGLYLAGPSSAAGVLGTGAGGWVAARAILADIGGRQP